LATNHNLRGLTQIADAGSLPRSPTITRVFKSFATTSWIGLFCTVCLVSTNCAGALPNYVTRVWSTDDGLPGSRVTAIVQSHEGYLWLGSLNGLGRFDGVRFTIFNAGNTPEMQSPHVTSLFEDANDTLWIGHETGELTVYRNGKFQPFPIPAWPGGKVEAIFADETADVWLLNDLGGLVRARDGFSVPEPTGRIPHLITLVKVGGRQIWVQRDNDVSVLKNGQLHPVKFDATGSSRYIQGIGASRDGGVWVMAESKIFKWKDGKWAGNFGPAPWGWDAVNMVVETQDGNLAAGTSDHGLYFIVPGQRSMQLCRTNSFPDNWVTSFCEDREGNLWVGTGNSGLVKLRSSNVTTFGPPDRWQGCAVLSVAQAAGGAVWVGTEGAGLYRFDNGSWTNFNQSCGLQHSYVWSVLPVAHGNLLAGTWGGSVFRWNGSQFVALPEFKNLSALVPVLLATTNDGVIIGTSSGLLRYDRGKINWLAREPALALPDVRAVVQQPDGTLWFGLSGGGLGRLQQGELRQYRRADGLASDFVQCLHLDSNGALWIGTIGGLNRLQAGKFATITKKQGLPDDTICAIEDDGRGFFWISSHGGILRVDQAELNHCAAGQIRQVHCLTYGLSDGLPTLECSGGFQPASCRTEDGRLWFPTSKGLVVLDPRNVKTNEWVPPVIIEKMLVDDQAVEPDAAARVPLRIAPGEHRFEFQFTGLCLDAPEKMHFLYRLAGAGGDWVDVQSPRTAYYSHLPPGNYRFEVRACNNDGVWNDRGAALSFTVEPEFWRTWWFRISGGVLTALAGGGIVWLDARRRMRRNVERLQRQQAVERERIRIARDIHDDLGANLTRITMLSESARSGLKDTRLVAGHLDQIHHTARELTRSMSEVVWAVNPRHDTLDSVAAYLEEFGQNLLRTAGLRCKMDMPSEFPARVITAEVRHNLFLAFKEALHNAIKHRGASEVRISLVVNAGDFTLRVADDGIGFAPQPVLAGAAPHQARQGAGNGLMNMHQRLAEIGGDCDVESAPGKGTRVTFRVPLNGALI